ncbi:hypothetical protein PS676_05958 [Pseudomonas fluorescens]|nr:hypothetical protein PS676_05958 [Pseudomonas fluorescens]
MAIGCIGQWTRRIRIKQAQHRTLSIGREQTGFHGAALALLLREQLIIVLHDRTLLCALNLGGQATVEVKAPSGGLCDGRTIDQPIQWVVVVVAEQGFSIGHHRQAS